MDVLNKAASLKGFQKIDILEEQIQEFVRFVEKAGKLYRFANN